MSNRTPNLDDRVYRYLLDHSLREDQTQRRFREMIAQLEQGVLQISPEQGQFRTPLVDRLGAERIVEVGISRDTARCAWPRACRSTVI